jgi:hypothetical protein
MWVLHARGVEELYSETSYGKNLREKEIQRGQRVRQGGERKQSC